MTDTHELIGILKPKEELSSRPLNMGFKSIVIYLPNIVSERKYHFT
jgi:hypothetical protein